MSNRLPFEIREAVVSVCGKCFWLKDPFRAFMLSCGVPDELYDRFAEESKYKIARHLLSELDALGEEGYQIQRRIVTELAKLRKVPDDNVPDRESALEALRWLKELAVNHKMVALKSKVEQQNRAEEARRRQAALVARANKMEQLRTTYAAIASATEDPQSRGYGLEDLLSELFAVHEDNIPPTLSHRYRTD